MYKHCMPLRFVYTFLTIVLMSDIVVQSLLLCFACGWKVSYEVDPVNEHLMDEARFVLEDGPVTIDWRRKEGR